MRTFFIALVCFLTLVFSPVAFAQTGQDASTSNNTQAETNLPTTAPKGGVRVIIPDDEPSVANSAPEAQQSSTLLYILAAAFLLIVGIVAAISFYSNLKPKSNGKNN